MCPVIPASSADCSSSIAFKRMVSIPCQGEVKRESVAAVNCRAELFNKLPCGWPQVIHPVRMNSFACVLSWWLFMSLSVPL